MINMDNSVKAQEEFDIQEYLERGVDRVVREALQATLTNPKETLFLGKYARASKKAAKTRQKEEAEGLHVPSFLIASITSSCNLHCAGCYSRHNHATEDCAPVEQLSGEEWKKIFLEAEELGVSFILLAGGEPMLRWDVIEAASQIPNIIFPIFTNGTYMGEKYFNLFDENRNLVPIMSIEGEKDTTDTRRGEGVYDKLLSNMEECQRRGIIYGASITVTTENVKEVSSKEFIDSLSERGCKVVIYVEFVPVTDEAQHLAPGDEEREYLKEAIVNIRKENENVVFISFPGDEKNSGGCLAAGRGFFHINSHGGAEPCPFSPFSDINVKDTSLKDALHSGLFEALHNDQFLLDDHIGGCVLYEKREEVEALFRNSLNNNNKEDKTMELTKEQRKTCLKAQQGELDAVKMYNALAEKVKDPKDAEMFKKLAAEEGRHASVFHNYTQEVLEPKNFKAVFVPCMYSLVGRKVLYKIIANEEYKAAKTYEPVVKDFPDVESVMNDETRHGDLVLSLLED